MPRNVKATSIQVDESFGMVQVMLEAKLTNPYNQTEKKVCTNSVLDIPFAQTGKDHREGFLGRDDAVQLAKNIAATIDRCISIDRQGF